MANSRIRIDASERAARMIDDELKKMDGAQNQSATEHCIRKIDCLLKVVETLSKRYD